MLLRIRCPECRTVLQVPPGTRPSCPRCGFSGREFKPSARQDPALWGDAPGQAEGAWAEQPADAAWADAGAGAGQAAGGQGAGEWQDTSSAWQDAPAAEGAWGDAAAQPASPSWHDTAPEPKRKKGLFRRK